MMFIKKSENYGYTSNLPWETIKVIRGFLNSEITNLDEYKAWVYQWRSYEKELVKAIRFLRKYRLDDNCPSPNYAWQESKFLGAWAKLFYEKRVENKEFFKSTILPDINSSRNLSKELENV